MLSYHAFLPICSQTTIGNTSSKGRQRLQEVFLSQLIKNATPVTVSLLNGVRLEGTVSSFDDFCISLEREGQVQAIYKQEISIISTSSPRIFLQGMPDDAPERPVVPMKSASRAPVVVERRRRFEQAGLTSSACPERSGYRFSAKDMHHSKSCDIHVMVLRIAWPPCHSDTVFGAR